MYGDTTVIRAHARRLADQANEIRRRADALLRSSAEVLWQGRAALAMQDRMRQRAGALARTADAHEAAAATLHAHADAVDDLKELIEEITRRVRCLVADARTRLAAVAEGLVAAVGVSAERADEWWASFSEPPAGHRDWLDFADTLSQARR